ncbi:MAG: hypothetical protein ACJ75J_01350 [Cytophagaceae bacterium]
MESIRRMIPLLLCFLIITVALATYALGLGKLIEEFDTKIMEQNLINFNWKYSH